MTWSREDIIADIKREYLDVDTTLPYWELRRNYRQARYTSAYLGSGSFGYARSLNSIPPPNKKVK